MPLSSLIMLSLGSLQFSYISFHRIFFCLDLYKLCVWTDKQHFGTNRLPCVHLHSNGPRSRPHFHHCATLWANPFDRLYRNLLAHRLSYGLQIMCIYIPSHSSSLSNSCAQLVCFFLSFTQVMSVKAVGIALKLSFSGSNQFTYFETWFFTVLVLVCCILQINYLNKVTLT